MHFLIIGVGSIGERHLRNFLRIEGVRCSIAEINADLREKIVGEYEVRKSYADYREADLSSFDGVVICTPANLHVPMATEVVSAGTHVLTEKPLAMSFEGLDELKQLRDKKGLVVSVAFILRSDPLIAEARELIASGDLGAVRMVNFYSGSYWPLCRKDYPPQYAQSRLSGGGVIPDMLAHQINYLQWMLGPVEEVSGKHWRLGLDDIKTEDTGFLTMRFAGGQVGQLGLSLCQYDANSRLQVITTGGTIQVVVGADSLDIFDGKTGQWTKGTARAIDRDDMFGEQAQHFIDCIQGKATPRCTIEEGEQTLRTILAGLESADTDGRFVKVGP